MRAVIIVAIVALICGFTSGDDLVLSKLETVTDLESLRPRINDVLDLVQNEHKLSLKLVAIEEANVQTFHETSESRWVIKTVLHFDRANVECKIVVSEQLHLHLRRETVNCDDQGIVDITVVREDLE